MSKCWGLGEAGDFHMVGMRQVGPRGRGRECDGRVLCGGGVESHRGLLGGIWDLRRSLCPCWLEQG